MVKDTNRPTDYGPSKLSLFWTVFQSRQTKNLRGVWAQARTLLVAPGHTTSNKTLLVTRASLIVASCY